MGKTTTARKDTGPKVTKLLDQALGRQQLPISQETPEELSQPTQTRDPGVSKSTWQTLLRDKAAAERRAHELEVEMQRQAESMRAAEAAIEEEAAKAEKLKADLEKAERERRDREALEELKRRQEATRLPHLKALVIQRQAEAAFRPHDRRINRWFAVV
ncbi:MAG: hypothetical protein Q9187_002580 [Circinaria calcarea]